MVAVACALLAIGYTVFYVAGSNLAHGPGKGVGFVEAIGLSTSSTPASSGSRPTAPGSTSSPTAPKPKPGASSSTGSGG